MARILSIAGDSDYLARCNRVLACSGHVVRGISRRAQIAAALAEGGFDLVIIWDDLPAGYAEALRAEITALAPQLPVLLPAGVPVSELAGSLGQLPRAA
ncbi:MAG: hypothetical protein ACE14M_11290 [Terriglobales bacterium]